MVKASEIFGRTRGGGSGFLRAVDWNVAGTYSFTVPVAGRMGCLVLGGGGGGAGTVSASAFATGGGGGGFAYGEYNVTAGDILTVIVGAGGPVTDLPGDKNGADGGTSSISGLPNGTTLTATGGQGGRSQPLGGAAFALGGTGSGGLLHFSGGRSGACLAGYKHASGGGGPATIFGDGGHGGDITVAADNNASAGGSALVDCPDNNLTRVGPGLALVQGYDLPGPMFDVAGSYEQSGLGVVGGGGGNSSNFAGAGGGTHTSNSGQSGNSTRYGGGGGGNSAVTWARGGSGGSGYAAIFFKKNTFNLNLDA